MLAILALLLQMNPSKRKFAAPYDSTIGVNKWFYLFALAVVLFLIAGVLKAFWDDLEWREKHLGKWLGKRK